MTSSRWKGRVVVDNDIHHRDPCIKGTRVPVSMIVGSLADGMTYAQIRADYPQRSTRTSRPPSPTPRDIPMRWV